MIEITLSYLAWTVVVLIQAIVHFWIVSGTRRPEDSTLIQSTTSEKNTTVGSDDNVKLLKNKQNELKLNDGVSMMVPHLQVSEDEFEEDQDSESFDGDEPQLFFELLDKTGLEMMKSCSSLENLVQEQLTKVDILLESSSLDTAAIVHVG